MNKYKAREFSLQIPTKNVLKQHHDLLNNGQTVTSGTYVVNGVNSFMFNGNTMNIPGNPYGILQIPDSTTPSGIEFVSFSSNGCSLFIYNPYANKWFSVQFGV